MKRILVVILLFLITSCKTPYGVLKESFNANSHFVGAQPVEGNPTGAHPCPEWTGLGFFKKCYLLSETYRSPAGTINDPLVVPISKFVIGRLQLHGAYVARSWGLNWFDSEGNPVIPQDFNEGDFYTFKKVPNLSAGFELVSP